LRCERSVKYQRGGGGDGEERPRHEGSEIRASRGFVVGAHALLVAAAAQIFSAPSGLSHPLTRSGARRETAFVT
jgi:hypothetical protein